MWRWNFMVVETALIWLRIGEDLLVRYSENVNHSNWGCELLEAEKAELINFARGERLASIGWRGL